MKKRFLWTTIRLAIIRIMCFLVMPAEVHAVQQRRIRTPRILSAILVLVLLLSVAPAVSFPVEAASKVPSGYTAIYTPEDLDNIRNNLAGKYILMNDIDLTSALASGGSLYDSKGWIAIGYSDGGSSSFTGIIDGNGHTITGFKVSSSKFSASFVYKNEGTLRNLTIQGKATFNNKSRNGVFCVYNYGTVQNCHNKVEIESYISLTGTSYVGGIVGENAEGGVVEYCSNQTTIYVSGSNGGGSERNGIVGGIAGYNVGTIRCCYNAGDISAISTSTCSAYAGGIAGGTEYPSVIQNSYNSGKITAKKTASTASSYNVGSGGIVGDGGYGINYIKCCYNVGSIVCSSWYDNEYYGGLCGYASKMSFTSCYYLNNVSKPIYSGSASGASSLTSNQMKHQADYIGFDFTNIWTMSTYPVLRAKCTHLVDYIAAKEATCTEDGNIAHYYCDICNQYFANSSKTTALSKADVVISKSHNFTVEVGRVAATCTEVGSLTMACDRCGEEQVQELPIDSANHTALVTDQAQSPDCTNTGLTEGSHCDACGVCVQKQEVIGALGHSYENVVTAPTCTEQGYTTHTCSVCGDSYKDSYVAENGHDWGEWYIVEEASCTAEGQEQRDCDTCGSYETNTLPVKAHSYESVVTAPTCTEQGYTTHTCSACGDSYKDSYVAENGHTEVIDEAVAATCTTTGLTEGKHCSVCQSVLVAQEMIPANGHKDENTDYTCDVCGNELCTDHTEEEIPGTPATCEKNGLTEGKKCAVCGEILKAQEVIPAKGHDWQDATCEKAKNCATCGKTEGAALGHSYGEWTQVKAPTVEEVGLSERVCATCGGKEQKQLEKLDPPATEPTQPTQPTEPAAPTEPGETQPEATEPTQPVPTEPQNGGDRDEGKGSPVLTIILSALGGAAITFLLLLILKKKKKDQEGANQ